MKKTLVFLIAVVVLTYAGFYGASWYGSYQILQRVKSEMADMGVLKWGRISPSIAGKVQVSDLRLTLFELNEPLRIGSVVFNAGAPQALVRFLYDPNASWPPLAELSFRQVQLALVQDMTKDWVVRPAAEGPRWPRPWELRACGEHRSIGGDELIAMGIDTLDMDLSLRWKDVSANDASLRGELNAGKLGSVDFVIRSDQLPHRIKDLSEALSQELSMRWNSLQLIVRDGGFMRRLAAFCAQDRYGSAEAWAQVATEALSRELSQWGVQPGSQLTALYRQWLREGGALTLGLPATQDMALSSPEAVAAYLEREDLTLLYNDRRVSGIDISLAAEEFAAQAAPAPPVAQAPAPVIDAPAWRETPLASASQWLERRVRVSLDSGRSLEGRLSAINGRQLEVARTLEGGEFGASAPLLEITGFEVWRRQAEAPVILALPPSEAPPPQSDDAAGSEPPSEQTVN